MGNRTFNEMIMGNRKHTRQWDHHSGFVSKILPQPIRKTGASVILVSNLLPKTQKEKKTW